jgi:predicted chitinase
MKPSTEGLLDKLAHVVQREIEQAKADERHRIAVYIQRRAHEVGSWGYQLAEDVELGLDQEDE